MTKAAENGVYTLTDEYGRLNRFKARKGDTLPEGAEFVVTDHDALRDVAEGKVKAEDIKVKKTTAQRGPSKTTKSVSTPETT